MSNKNSHLLNGVSAGVLAAVFFFLNAVSGILNSLWAWFLPIMLVLIILLFFFDSNTLVRECMVQIFILWAASFVSWLLFCAILGSIGFFRVVDWVIRAILCLVSIISGLVALGGKRFMIPLLEPVVSGFCKVLGVY